MTGWQVALVVLSSLVAGTLSGFVGLRLGMRRGATASQRRAIAKAKQLEGELKAILVGVEARTQAAVEQARAEGREALRGAAVQDLDELIREAKELRKELGL